MGQYLPEFDFSKYNPADPWSFPPQRLVHFAFEASNVFRASRDKWLRIKPYPDLRYVVFHELNSLGHTFKVFSLLIRENSTDADWWREQKELGGHYDKMLVKSVNSSMRDFLQYGIFHFAVRQTEDAIRQIHRYLVKVFGDKPKSGIREVYIYLFNRTDLSKYIKLMDLLMATRTCFQNNKKFCPSNGKGVTLEYGGKSFSFENKVEIKPQDWGFIDDWDFILFLFREIDKMLDQLFDSNFVASIPSLRAKYLD